MFQLQIISLHAWSARRFFTIFCYLAKWFKGALALGFLMIEWVKALVYPTFITY